MDFQNKNFAYSKKNLHVFFDEVAQGSRQYLRSLAFEKPAEQPANFWVDYPELASDFVLPPELEMVSQEIHSSVLRISGPVNMWLHYDVMANVLCQIRGTKRLILYPPSDVSLLSIPPGTSSSSINCFDPNSTEKPSLASAHPYEALLEPGDILFIPPLWLHAASPMDKVSISVNVFFRDLETGYAPGRDVYGNRDVQAYEKGRKDIEKITKSFYKLPRDMVKFYLERLADELKEKALHYG
jgi:tRNA wybutosine-synthesizing protein 4